MASRVGMCSGCNSRFKIPESYSGDRAKCRKCGGIIEIEPAEAPVASAPQDESVNEAQLFDFANLRARMAAQSQSFAEHDLVEHEAEPDLEAAPETDVSETVEESSEASEPAAQDEMAEPAESFASEEPVEPIAPPPPQRTIAAPKRTELPHAEKHHEKHHADQHHAEKAHDEHREKHHEKRHSRIGALIAVLLVAAGGAYFLITTYLHDASEETASTTPPKSVKRGAKAALAPKPEKSGKTEDGAASDAADGKDAAAGDEAAVAEGEAGSEAAAEGETESSGLKTVEETEAEKAAAAPAPDAASAKFEFVAIERSPGTTDEEWARMQELSAALRTGGKGRKAALKELLDYGIKAVPVLVNSLNGLDLSKYSQWVDGAEVSRFIQDDLLAETILIPYHGAFSTDAKEVKHNQVVLKSMVDYWNTQVNDPARWGALLRKYEEKREMRGGRRGSGDSGD